MPMAVVAGTGRAREFQRAMALRTTGHGVQAKQREIREFMVEHQVAVPVLLAVAGIATLLQRTTVRLVGPMAGGAVALEFLLLDDGGMADMAAELGVHADEREPGLDGVIVVDRLPLFIAVAGLALHAQAHRVRIVRLVAAVTLPGQFVLEVAAAVAGGTVKLRVAAQQREVGLLLVVEPGHLPVAGRVALATVLAARTTVRVVGGMAADAASRLILVVSTEVAGVAGGPLVRASQREPRLAMIVARRRPAALLVAVDAAARAGPGADRRPCGRPRR